MKRTGFIRWIFLLLLFIPRDAVDQTVSVIPNRCQTFDVSRGDVGEGKLRYCDDGFEQQVYVSGELDFRETDKNEKNAADLIAIKKVLREFKKRETGVFRVLTNNAGGGETEWHQRLIMAVEDACTKDCRIITEIKGRCESACNQLHITCVRNARTILHKAGATCEHATTDEDNPRCNKRDPFDRSERDLCGTHVAVNEYKERCGELTKGRGLDIDDKRKKQIYEFLDGLALRGVFDTTRLTCTPITWAETDPAVGDRVITR